MSYAALMSTVSWTWSLRGRVAWSALTPVFAFLYGLTVVLAYAIFRQGMGRVLSFACALALAVSTLHLNNLPPLRDYGKAPFVLALVLMAIRLVLPPVTTRRTLRRVGIRLDRGIITWFFALFMALPFRVEFDWMSRGRKPRAKNNSHRAALSGAAAIGI